VLDRRVSSRCPKNAPIILFRRSWTCCDGAGKNILNEIGRNIAVSNTFADKSFQLTMMRQKQGANLFTPVRHFDPISEPSGHQMETQQFSH
jgi:hypothetical protein